MASGTRVTGLRETVRNLERLGVDVQDLRDAFGAISQEVAQEAGGRVRVKTGAHKASIRPARTKNKAVVRAGNNTNAPAAGVLNYGGHGITGDEFLTGPANANPEDKARQIDQNLQHLIIKYNLR
jgi:hypothetical protein